MPMLPIFAAAPLFAASDAAMLRVYCFHACRCCRQRRRHAEPLPRLRFFAAYAATPMFFAVFIIYAAFAMPLSC